jgi:hypothetical protein
VRSQKNKRRFWQFKVASLPPSEVLYMLYQRQSAYYLFVELCRPLLHQDLGCAGTAGNRFARDVKELGPQLGGTTTPVNGLVKPPRLDTRALSPAAMFGEKGPLRLAAQKRIPRV